MAEIAPLRGIRFDRTKTGPIGPLLAPPYDVATAVGSNAEFSISDIENVNLGVEGNQHSVAAQRYREWLSAGILRRDDAPALYVHRHTFPVNGDFRARTGIIARVRLRDWESRVILPHEGTNPGPRAERLARLRAVSANLSPLYFLCRDAEGELRDVIEQAIEDRDAPDEFDRMGGSHLLLPVFAADFHRRLSEFFAQRALFVADGHHRYEAAIAYRNAQRARFPNEEGPWEFVLALIAAVEDPGVVVRPTHRLVIGTDIATRKLMHLLSRWFVVEEGEGATDAIPETELFRVMLADSPRPWAVRARPGNPHLTLLPEARGASWRSLAISTVEGVLESLVRDGVLTTEHQIVPIVDAGAAIAHIQNGTANAAFFLPPPPLDRLFAVAEEGDLLPPKSTWFEPKAPAGLVINDLSRSGTT